jgi:hypothetical protein
MPPGASAARCGFKFRTDSESGRFFILITSTLRDPTRLRCRDKDANRWVVLELFEGFLLKGFELLVPLTKGDY